VEVEIEFNIVEMRLDVFFTADDSFDITRDDVTLTPDSEYALEGDATYYFALEYECPNGCLIRAQGEVVGSENEPPVANAGEDQEVEQWATVMLDGSGSSDPEGGELSYEWEKLSGSPIELAGANTAQANFWAEEEGTYEFQLTVTDPEGGAGQDTVTITVLPEPEGDAGPEPDGGVDGGADSGSSDVDARPVMSAGGGSCDCSTSGSESSGVSRYLLSLFNL
jgi:chitinase